MTKTLRFLFGEPPQLSCDYYLATNHNWFGMGKIFFFKLTFVLLFSISTLFYQFIYLIIKIVHDLDSHYFNICNHKIKTKSCFSFQIWQILNFDLFFITCTFLFFFKYFQFWHYCKVCFFFKIWFRIIKSFFLNCQVGS